jgi:hypothetical protein
MTERWVLAHTTVTVFSLGLVFLVVTGCATPARGPTPTPGSVAAANYKDASYTIEGRVITLANGVSEIAAGFRRQDRHPLFRERSNW